MGASINTSLKFFQRVPISSGMTPIYNNWKAQQEDFERFKRAEFPANVYIDYNRGHVDIKQSEEHDQLMFFCNYLSFINTKYENKFFYCKITGFKKLANKVIRISFIVDSFQTYMFDFRMKSSHIERQHLSEEKWQMAIADPFRRDIQELATDEGVNFNKEDEITYDNDKVIDWVGGYHCDKMFDKSESGGYVAKFTDPDFRSSIVNFGITNGDGYLTVVMSYSDKAGDVTYATSNRGNPQYGSSGLATYLLNRISESASSKGGLSPCIVGAPRSSEFKNEIIELVRIGNNYMSTVEPDRTPDKMPYSLSQSTELSITSEISTWLESYKVYSSDVIGMYRIPLGLIFSVCDGVFKKYQTSEPTFIFAKSRYKFNVTDYNDIPGYGVIEDPKLRRSPYRYIRVTTPGGDDKEYPIENFSGNNPVFRFSGDFSDGPAMYMWPRNYLGQVDNIQENLVNKSYQMFGYRTDAFAQYVNERNRSYVLNDSKSAKRARDMTSPVKDKQTGKTSSAGILQRIGMAINAFKGYATNITDPQKGIENAGAPIEERMKAEEAYNSGNNSETGESYDGVYSHQRSALVGLGQYNAGRDSTIANREGQDDFKFELVTIRHDILTGLDQMLKVFGYRCDYFHTPNAYKWIRGEGAPHWVSVDDMTFTYVKTNGAQVYSVFDGAASDIASIFDSGVRLTKGLQG